MAAPMSPQDRLDVMELVASGSLFQDGADIDGFVSNFTPDVEYVWASGQGKGQAVVRERMEQLIGSGTVGASPATLRHFVGLPQISGDSEKCRSRTYCVIFNYDDTRSIQTPLVATYDDTCVKVDGKWKISRRHIISDLGAPSSPPKK